MPYDFYDFFIKQRNNKNFTEVSNIVRQKLWRETYDVIESQEWEEITDKIRKG
ncbi:hypothetical protein [uncultured Methanobrevibacter sp.]|uniref:hypothetical protein n=1 Tax=uncultured Methanobrevibacter sp. TaxID=253161 RepID=UPI0025D8BD5A|nr:hypothetical protein [uncultured Methanobrevibacter sp.]